MKNAQKLTNVFREHEDPFMATEDEDEIYNILMKEVMNEKYQKISWNGIRLDNACLWSL